MLEGLTKIVNGMFVMSGASFFDSLVGYTSILYLCSGVFGGEGRGGGVAWYEDLAT